MREFGNWAFPGLFSLEELGITICKVNGYGDNGMHDKGPGGDFGFRVGDREMKEHEPQRTQRAQRTCPERRRVSFSTVCSRSSAPLDVASALAKTTSLPPLKPEEAFIIIGRIIQIHLPFVKSRANHRVSRGGEGWAKSMQAGTPALPERNLQARTPAVQS